MHRTSPPGEGGVATRSRPIEVHWRGETGLAEPFPGPGLDGGDRELLGNTAPAARRTRASFFHEVPGAAAGEESEEGRRCQRRLTTGPESERPNRPMSKVRLRSASRDFVLAVARRVAHSVTSASTLMPGADCGL